MGRGPRAFSTPIRHVEKLMRVSFLKQILCGDFIVFLLKEKNVFPLGDSKHVCLFPERNRLSGVILSQGSAPFFCKEHTFWALQVKEEDQGCYVDTSVRTVRKGTAVLSGRLHRAGGGCLSSDPFSSGSLFLHNFPNSWLSGQRYRIKSTASWSG